MKYWYSREIFIPELESELWTSRYRASMQSITQFRLKYQDRLKFIFVSLSHVYYIIYNTQNTYSSNNQRKLFTCLDFGILVNCMLARLRTEVKQFLNICTYKTLILFVSSAQKRFKEWLFELKFQKSNLLKTRVREKCRPDHKINAQSTWWGT